jgi:hypothetical protein
MEDFWPKRRQVCEGSFGVLFIMLAGIGVSLMTQKARINRDMSLLKKPKNPFSPGCIPVY